MSIIEPDDIQRAWFTVHADVHREMVALRQQLEAAEAVVEALPRGVFLFASQTDPRSWSREVRLKRAEEAVAAYDATRSRGDGAAVTHSSAETPGGGGPGPDSPIPAPEEGE